MEEPKRQSVRVVVFSQEQYDGLWPDGNLLAFQSWLAEQIAKIPPEFAETAVIDIGSVASYEDSHYANLEIFYSRPETDEEVAARITKVRFKEEAARRQELHMLATLKAKYGNDAA